MDIGAFVSLEDISANLPPYTKEVVSVPMDKPLAEAYESLEKETAEALQEHRGNRSGPATSSPPTSRGYLAANAAGENPMRHICKSRARPGKKKRPRRFFARARSPAPPCPDSATECDARCSGKIPTAAAAGRAVFACGTAKHKNPASPPRFAKFPPSRRLFPPCAPPGARSQSICSNSRLSSATKSRL